MLGASSVFCSFSLFEKWWNCRLRSGLPKRRQVLDRFRISRAFCLKEHCNINCLNWRNSRRLYLVLSTLSFLRPSVLDLLRKPLLRFLGLQAALWGYTLRLRSGAWAPRGRAGSPLVGGIPSSGKLLTMQGEMVFWVLCKFGGGTDSSVLIPIREGMEFKVKLPSSWRQ